MAAIIKIEFWKDIGFIDGAVEIPSVSAADPVNPDIVIEPDEPIMPSRERLFSEVKLKEYYSELLTVSYMRVTYELKNSLGVDVPYIFYGWITDVSLTSDGELPATTISWHIDEWRTWKSAVSFGSGHVKRRPFIDIDSTPIQNYPIRYLELDDTGIAITNGELIPRYVRNVFGTHNDSIWWIIFTFNKTTQVDQDTSITSIEKGAIPVWIRNTLTNGKLSNIVEVHFKATSSGTLIRGLSIAQLLEGKLDEYMGLPPDTINGVWISPYLFDPSILSGAGDSVDPLVINLAGLTAVQSGVLTYGYLNITNIMNYHSEQTVVPGTIITGGDLCSTETEQYIVTDFDGSKALDLPYGMKFTSWNIELIIEADTAAIAVSFRDGLDGRTEGTVATLPLPSLPVNTNALSEYVYSGQRDYDRESRTIESNASAWKSSATGAGSGAMMGAFGPAGLAIGAAGGLSGGLISYGVEMLYQNDEEQRIMDRLKARQPSSLLLSSNAISVLLRGGKGPALRRLVPDDYSLSQIADMKNQFGISVDELSSSTDTLIKTTAPTGYYNIQNLIVSGDIPVSAKRWIRQKFASGVRLI